MLRIVHCLLHYTNGSLIGGCVPVLTESILENSMQGINNKDDYFINPQYPYHDPDLNAPLQYNIFRNFDDCAIKSRHFQNGHVNSIIHNTFYNCYNSIFNTKNEYYSNYLSDNVFLSETEIIDNLFYINILLHDSDSIILRKYNYNLLNGFFNPVYNILENGNLEAGLIPLFFSEDENLRLMMAGIEIMPDLIAQYDSPGALFASDGTNMGGYHIEIDDLDISLEADQDIFLESPPITKFVMTGLNNESVQGIENQFSWATDQFYNFILSYSLEYAHERQRVTHVLKWLRHTKTPVRWFPFAKPQPRLEDNDGRNIAHDYWDWYSESFVNFVLLGENMYIWQLSDIEFTTIDIPYKSWETYEIMEATVTFPVHPSGTPSFDLIDLDIFNGIIIQSQLPDSHIISALITGKGSSNNRIRAIILEKYIKTSLPDQIESNLGMIFWGGTVSYHSFDRETNTFQFGIPISIPTMPKHSFDNFILTLQSHQLIKQYLEGDTMVPFPIYNSFGEIYYTEPDCYDDSFILKSTKTIVNNEEIYYAKPIGPKNLWKWQALSDWQIEQMENMLTHYSSRLLGLIDSMLIYPSQDEIESTTQAENIRDIFFCNEAHWLSNFEQQKNSTEGWGSQNITLMQTLAHRALLPFPNLINAEINIQPIPPAGD